MNLQPLKWDDLDNDPMLAPVSLAESPIHHYTILKDGEGVRVRYAKKGADFDYATGFATIDDAKTWCWNHYNEKMQPYFKPMPTWIDAKKQLPQVEKDTQFICSYGSALEPFSKVVWFNADIGEFNYEHDSVIAWMPIPEFSEVTK